MPASTSMSWLSGSGSEYSARKKVADNGLQMAVVQETPRHKGTHPRRRFGGVEPILPVAAHGIPDFHLLLLIRIRVLVMECISCGNHWTSGQGCLLPCGNLKSFLRHDLQLVVGDASAFAGRPLNS